MVCDNHVGVVCTCAARVLSPPCCTGSCTESKMDNPPPFSDEQMAWLLPRLPSEARCPPTGSGLASRTTIVNNGVGSAEGSLSCVPGSSSTSNDTGSGKLINSI